MTQAWLHSYARDVLEPSDRAVLDQIHAKQPAAPDHDPAIGDLVITFVDLVVDGEPVRDWIVARVTASIQVLQIERQRR